MLPKLLITLALQICLSNTLLAADAAGIETVLERARKTEGPILVVSDFNGVLSYKHVKFEALDTLRKDVIAPLAGAPHITFYVSSSKCAQQLDQMLGKTPNLGLSAEHNMMLKLPDSAFFFPTNINPNLAGSQLAQIEKTAARHGISPKREKNHEGFDHEFSRNFNKWPKDMTIEQAKDKLDKIAKNVDTKLEAVIDPSLSKKQIMVASTNRGKGKLVEKMLAMGGIGYGIALGDKPADEGMLEAMRAQGFAAILVGPNNEEAAKSHGYIHLSGPEDVHDFLKRLADQQNSKYTRKYSASW